MRAHRRNFAVLIAVMLLASTTAGHAATVRVVIEQLVFSPEIITARTGDTIEWVNRDALEHTATVDGDWDVVIPAGETATFVPTKAGTVEYYCRFHPNMKGRLDVLTK
jgi:plastocyanin